MAGGGYFETKFINVIKEKKLCVDMKWREMSSKMTAGCQGDFRQSKMAASGQVNKFQYKIKLSIDMKWREMRSNWFSVIQYKGDIQLSHTCK